MVEIQAHRGNTELYRENTLQAFSAAWQAGADYIELDVHLTKDEKVVVFHDFFIDTKASSLLGLIREQDSWLIKDLNLCEIKDFYFSDEKTEGAIGYYIPTLEDVIDLIKSSPHPHAQKIRLNIELKRDPRTPHLSFPPSVIIRRVMEVLTEKQFTNRVMFSSFDPQMLAELKNRGLNSQTILLCDEHTLSFIKETFKQPPVEYLSHFSAQLGIFTIAIDHRLIASKGILHCFKDLKIKVIAWTANEEKDWKRLISYGIDAIITDKPTALANYLQANKKHLLKANLKKGSRRIISALKCPKFP